MRACHSETSILDAAERLSRGSMRWWTAQAISCTLHRFGGPRPGMSANISEGFGRREDADRKYRLKIARRAAEETISWLRSNYTSSRITSGQYWPIHHLLVTIVKMLTSRVRRRS